VRTPDECKLNRLALIPRNAERINGGSAYCRFMDTKTAAVLLVQLQVNLALVSLVIYLVKNR
jgi:hypothetical protein